MRSGDKAMIRNGRTFTETVTGTTVATATMAGTVTDTNTNRPTVTDSFVAMTKASGAIVVTTIAAATTETMAGAGRFRGRDDS